MHMKRGGTISFTTLLLFFGPCFLILSKVYAADPEIPFDNVDFLSPQKTCLITGAGGGLGKEISEQLMRRGHRVILAAKKSRESEVIKFVTDLVGNGVPAYGEHLELDLNSFESVRAAVESLGHEGIKI